MTTQWPKTAEAILYQRYLLRDRNGEVIETPDGMLERVARHVAKAEKAEEQERWYNEFMNILAPLEFLPNSPTLMNSGNELGQLSGCFLIPIVDDLSAIMEAVKQTALIHKSGGGTGLVFSHLRPRNSMVASTCGVASGPVSFMRIFDMATGVIKQGGKRRGANIGILSCLSGDTLVDTLFGRKKIRDLVGTVPFLYCTDGNKVFVRQAVRIFENGVKETIRVWFDDGSFLDCTPEHRIMMADRSYVEASKLRQGESVMVLCKHMDLGGRFHLKLGASKASIPQAHAICEMKFGKTPKQNGRKRKGSDLSAHHVDGNCSNDAPENIDLLAFTEHCSKHGKEEFWKNMIPDMERRKGKTLEEAYGEEKAAIWKQKMRGPRSGSWNKGIGTEEYKKHYVDGFKNQYTNHKVVCIEALHPQKVYDVEMPDFHNFAANGIFVHNCNHPDIFDFISCKEDTTQFQNFNISVSITDNFMKAVKNENGYPLRNPYTKEKKYIAANELFHKICEQAWRTGEPGLIFIDTINNTNLIPELGRIEGTNPCGELPLLPYESCNLGSIDLSKMVKNGKIDWDRLGYVIAVATRFLDDVIDVNKYPNVKIARKTRMARKIGLGVMGWADMLIGLGIRYDSDEALSLATRVMSTIQETSHSVSADLGQEKGCCMGKLKRRNAATTTIAPTGTLSMIADCSSGIEPVYAREFTKTVLDGVVLDLGSKYKEVPSELMVVAHDVPVERHIAMQSAFQKHVDNAVSKTINLPKTAKVASVAKAFMLSHELGCKGITVYRDGSREAPVKATGLSECDGERCQI